MTGQRRTGEPRPAGRRPRARDRDFRRRCALLNELALALAGYGARPMLRQAGEPGENGRFLLQVAGEAIECGETGGRYVFVTESGTVLGFADDPHLVDELVVFWSLDGEQQPQPAEVADAAEVGEVGVVAVAEVETGTRLRRVSA